MSPKIRSSSCWSCIFFNEKQIQADSSPPPGKTMAPESYPDAPGSNKQFPVKCISEDFTSTVAAQDHKSLEETIDFLVDLLSNGDKGKQRQAAEALTKLKRASRDRLRAIGATSLLVDRLSSPDIHIREHMMTLLYRLSSDEEETYGHKPGDTFNRRTTTGVIHSLLRVGPGPKAYETAAKLLLKLTNIDRMKDSVASSGGIESLIEMLRFKNGLSFQKEVITTLIDLLKDHHEHEARAIRWGLPRILLRILLKGPPQECDMGGILDLMAVLATYDGGHDVLVQIKTPEALVEMVRSGKLLAHREKVTRLAETLTEDYKQATKMFEDLMAPAGGEVGENLGKDTRSIEPIRMSSSNGLINGPANGDMKDFPNRDSPKITNDISAPRASNGHVTNLGSKPIPGVPHNGSISKGPADQVNAPGVDVPEEFLCPLSKQIMKDPVSVSTGQTYEREYIQRWIAQGNVKCPETRYRLKNFVLTPNIKLKSKISLWQRKNENLATNETERTELTEQQQEPQHEHEKLEAVENQVEDWKDEEYKRSHDTRVAAPQVDPLPSLGPVDIPFRNKSDRLENGSDQNHKAPARLPTDSIPNHPQIDENKKKVFEIDEDFTMGELDDRPATDEEIARVQSLMEVLTSGNSSEKDLTIAALEMHELALACQSLRDEIVIVGALDTLASILSPEHSASTQEAGVATLLILSLNDENKKLMAHPKSAVVPAIVHLLKIGSEDSREKAASTLFSLSIPDENKVFIGASDAIPALVDILSGRDPLSKKAQKDAATCLLTLSIYTGNKARAVRVGVVPYLVALLDDESLLDLVLAMLAVLSSHGEGREAIQEERSILPKLTEIMRSGVDRNVENALTIFSTLLLKNSTLFEQATKLGAIKLILELHSNASGQSKIRTKTTRLLAFMEKYDFSLNLE